MLALHLTILVSVQQSIHCVFRGSRFLQTMAPKRKRNSEAVHLTRKFSIAAVDPSSNSQVLDGFVTDTTPPDAAIPSIKSEGVVEEDLEDDDFIPEAVQDQAQVFDVTARPPPVNSDYLPLPWKGRLGYVSR
jgi:hypothetical protein